MTTALFARHALLPQGWRRDVLFEWDAHGDLTRVAPGATVSPGTRQAQYVLPGMVNLHSHAFQRALGGLTEVAGDGPDSFWTWRDLMYRFARSRPSRPSCSPSACATAIPRCANSTTCSATSTAPPMRGRPRRPSAWPRRDRRPAWA